MNRYSLAVRNALIYFFLFVLGIGLTGILMLNHSSNDIKEASQRQLVHSTELAQLFLEDKIEALTNDVHLLANGPFLQSYIAEPTEKGRQLLNESYLNLLSSKLDYAQIRFIDGINGGVEAIRVDRRSGQIFVVPPDALQNKSDRPYYTSTMLLNEGEVFISPIDLNKEFGQISYPRTPTVRVAQPVFHKGQRVGMVIINLNLNTVFDRLQKIVESNYQLTIVNNEGHYLLHPDSSKTFLFEFDQPSIFHDDFNKSSTEWIKQGHGTYEHKEIFHAFQSFLLPGAKNPLLLITSIQGDKLFQDYYYWRNQSLWIIGLLGLIFLGIAFYVLNRQISSLREITEKLKNFPKTLKVDDLPTKRKDEIGDLAKGLEEMAAQLKNTVQSLEESKSKTEAAVKEKEEFIENFSHEIRNPLQAISGIGEVMLSTQPSPGQLELIKNMRFNTNHLNALINDVLDYQQVIKGNIEFNPEWIHLRDFIHQIYKSHNYEAILKQVQLMMDFDEDLDNLEISIDPVRLAQIIHNLIINAIKFTPKLGTVTLQVCRQNESIKVAVKDTGVGIKAEDIEQIKNRYYSVSNNNSSSGYGLGLSIVTHLLNEMDTALQIDSELKSGSTFYFNLTVDERTTFDESNHQDMINAPLSVKRVLVIEDDPQIVLLYQHLFNESAIVIKTPQEIEHLEKEPFDLILTDNRLEHHILKDFAVKLIPFISDSTLIYIVSANQNIPLDQLPFKVDRTILKPFQLNGLRLLIEQDYKDLLFGVPDFSSIQEDYDFQKEKYDRAINILLKEWQEMKEELSRAIEGIDQESVFQIRHKIITSVRRLKLSVFENFLLSFDDIPPEEWRQKKEFAINAMHHYLTYIGQFLNKKES